MLLCSDDVSLHQSMSTQINIFNILKSYADILYILYKFLCILTYVTYTQKYMVSMYRKLWPILKDKSLSNLQVPTVE